VIRSADEQAYAVARARVRVAPDRTVGLVAVGLAAVLALGACGQPAPSDDALGPTVSVEVQPTIAPETPTVEAPDTSAPVAGGLYDASSSLVASTCAPTGDVWNFTGTVQNTDSMPHTFTVAVFIVPTSGASTVAGKEIDVTVGPGEKGDVVAKAFWSGPATGVECLTGVTVKEE